MLHDNLHACLPLARDKLADVANLRSRASTHRGGAVVGMAPMTVGASKGSTLESCSIHGRAWDGGTRA